MSIDLNGKVAVVTGAGSGLGRAHAELLARLGASVVINDIGVIDTPAGRRPVAEVAAEEISATTGARVIAHVEDVGTMNGGRSLVELAISELGGLDVVVNNAGIVRDKMIFNMDEQSWDDVVRVHGKGTFAVCQAATHYFRDRAKAGNQRPASIINTTSETGLFGNVGQANYAFAKAGIVGLSLTIHQEMERYGVRCNVISPRARTAMTVNSFDVNAPVGEGCLDLLNPAHVSPVVAYLASDASAPIAGQVFIVFGGEVHLMNPITWAEFYSVKDRYLNIDELDEHFKKVFQHRTATPPTPRHRDAMYN